MKQAISGKVQIGPYEIAVARQINHKNITLVFIHGNSLSIELWQKQFASNLGQHFNLLAFDLPGHGTSFSSSQPDNDYTLQAFREIVQGLIATDHIHQFILVGHSLGGHIAIETLPHVSGCLAVVTIGTPPLNKPANLEGSFLPSSANGYLFSPTLPHDERKAFARAQLRKNAKDIPAFILENYDKTDPNLRVQIGTSAIQGHFDNEIEILQQSTVPVILLLGEEDQLVNLQYLLEIPHHNKLHQVIVIPDAGHLAPYENPVHFNNVLIRISKYTADYEKSGT